jgi:hypothetical protein
LSDLIRRKEGRAAEVTKSWEGQTVAVICTGPSLNKKDLDRVQSLNCIVVNDAYLVAPWAKVLYAADDRWWKWQLEGKNKVWPWVSFTKEQVRQAYAEFKGQKVTIQHPTVIQDQDILILENDGSEGLSFRPDAIRTGHNSGYQALNIAILSGAKKILLLGFDMRFINGKSHAHNGHEVKMAEHAYKKYAQNFSSMQHDLRKIDVDIVNCTEGSLINCFRFSTVELESIQFVESPALVSG